jgi:hypothetical protein
LERAYGQSGRGQFGGFGSGRFSRFGRGPFFNNRYCGRDAAFCGYGYGYGGYGWPYYGYGGAYWPLWSDYSDNGNENDDTQSVLSEQQQLIGQLENQLAEQQQYQAEMQAGAPAPSGARIPRSHPSSAEAETPTTPTVLVFRDQHRVETSNYAIANNKLYILDPNGRSTVALSELDIPATVKANEDRGVEFRLPKIT